VIRLIALEPAPRNHALLRLAYLAGLRISEICGLRWRDTKRRATGGQITVFGKGGKTRAVLLRASMWRELDTLRGAAVDDDPVFRSAKGGALDPSQVHRVVKRAAARAGLPNTVSAHYLRHAHVSTRSTAARRRTWCRPRSGIAICARRRATRMPSRARARQRTCGADWAADRPRRLSRSDWSGNTKMRPI